MANGSARKFRHQSESAAREGFDEAREAALEAYANLLDARRKFAKAAHSAGIELKDGTHDQFEEAMGRMHDRVEDTFDKVHERVDETVGRMHDKGTEWQERSEAYISRNPLAVAGVLFATGIVLSRLFNK